MTDEIQLTVLNDTSEPLTVDLCQDYLTDSTRCSTHTVTQDSPATLTYTLVQGTLHNRGSDLLSGEPRPGKPLVRLAAANAMPEMIEKARDGGSPPGYEPFVGSPTEDIRFVEGEVQQRTVNGHLERQGAPMSR